MHRHDRAGARGDRSRTAAGSRQNVRGSQSAKTGRRAGMDDRIAVAQNVSGVVTTSSPGPTPAASSERCSAAVQEFTATA